MTTNPYWIRIRGSGDKNEWDTGRVFGGANFRKGVEVYVGTQQGAAILRVYADESARVRARLMTAQHRWPPKSGAMKGREAIVQEIFVRNPEEAVPLEDQMQMFGVGSDVCRSCGAPIFWVETSAGGRSVPLSAETERRTIINRSGRAQVIDTHSEHNCPEAESFL